MKLSEAYIIMQEASGIEVGDTVKVQRVHLDREMGCTIEASRFDKDWVGKIGVVTKVRGSNGIYVDDRAWPFFCLELISKGKDDCEGKVVEIDGVKYTLQRA